MGSYEIVGLVAGAFTSLAPLPQLYKSIKTKSMNDISLAMYLSFLTGTVLWLTYGILLNSIGIVIWNIFALVVYIATVTVKILNMKGVYAK